MTAPQNFRSAFNGFHREDVVNYIAYMTNKHETQVNQLNTEVAQLQQERDGLQEQQTQLKQQDEQLREQVKNQEQMTSELEQLRQQIEQMKEQLSERDIQIELLEEELQQEKAKEKVVAAPAPVQPKNDMVRMAEELNAYRRAESVERRAREQVNQMFDKACGTLADTSVSLENATGKICELEEMIIQNLVALQETITESKTELANSAVTIASIRPEKDG